jgi:hypothetical protein
LERLKDLAGCGSQVIIYNDLFVPKIGQITSTRLVGQQKCHCERVDSRMRANDKRGDVKAKHYFHDLLVGGRP